MQLLKQLFKKKFVKEEHDKKTGQEGMTLLEVIIVLGIMGVVSAGVVTLAQRAIDSQNMTKAAQNLNSVQIAMTQTYRSLGNYPATANANAATQLANGLVSLVRFQLMRQRILSLVQLWGFSHFHETLQRIKHSQLQSVA